MAAILGTAGHIDHGKTALVRALTGQDTDRLAEEKERGISIDLGFAHLDLADGTRAGIVDVPGHERFIRNMLAGAHGIDVVLLVVAADDGVMPQTEEHFDIVRLLGVERGVVVLTKADLVAPARLAEVGEEVEILLAGSRLASSPRVAVSSTTGAGLDDLRAEIGRQLEAVRPRAVSGAFRMPVDRVFVMQGHGVVVTGTATSGRLRPGDSLRLLPGGEACRVRGLQVHGAAVDEAVCGQRVAVNLAGVERTRVERGHVLVDPRYRHATARLDAVVELLAGARRPLRNHGRVRLHAGTASVPARVVLLERGSELGPGERALAQLVLAEEIAAVCGDRFVLRDASSQRTLGGGWIVQPRAERHRRGDGAAEGLWAVAGAGDLAARLAALLRARGRTVVPLDDLLEILPQSSEEIVAALRQAPDLVLLPSAASPEVAATAAAIAALEERVAGHLAAQHRAAPSSPGVDMESTRSSSAPELAPKLFRAVVAGMEGRGALVREGSLLRLASHRGGVRGADRAAAVRLTRLLAEAELAPPDVKLLEQQLGMPRPRLLELLGHVEREGGIVRVAPDLYFAAPAVEKARRLLDEHLGRHGEISAAAFRDLIRGSRKFSIALLDYFDRTGVTLRVGDLRRPRRRG